MNNPIIRGTVCQCRHTFDFWLRNDSGRYNFARGINNEYLKRIIGTKVSVMIGQDGCAYLLDKNPMCVLLSDMGGPWFESVILKTRQDVARFIKGNRKSKKRWPWIEDTTGPAAEVLGFEYYRVGDIQVMIIGGETV